MPWEEFSALEERTRLVLAIKEGRQSVAHLSRQFGISRQTAYKWWRRYARGGLAELTARSSRPHRRPPRMTSRWQELLDAEHEAEGRSILDALLLESNEELAGATWETRLLAGSPADAILEVAAEEDADAIVVGSHGYSGAPSLVGSVSQELLRRADRPVSVIPPRCAALAAESDAGSAASA